MTTSKPDDPGAQHPTPVDGQPGTGIEAVVATAVEMLAAAGRVPGEVARIVEGLLGREMDERGDAEPAGAAGVAARAAYAHLRAGQVEEAYLALCTVADHLGYPPARDRDVS